jgi:hypothetical protein
MKDFLKPLGFSTGGKKAVLWERVKFARSALAAEVPELSVCLCDKPSLADDVQMPGYGEQCKEPTCMRYVRWPNRHEREEGCSADDDTCNIDADAEVECDVCTTCQRQYHIGDECNEMRWGRDEKNHLSKFCSDCFGDWQVDAEAAKAALTAAAAAPMVEG